MLVSVLLSCCFALALSTTDKTFAQFFTKQEEILSFYSPVKFKTELRTIRFQQNIRSTSLAIRFISLFECLPVHSSLLSHAFIAAYH